MYRITEKSIHDHLLRKDLDFYRTAEAFSEIFGSLAPWMMTQTAREYVKLPKPKPPDAKGSAWVLLVYKTETIVQYIDMAVVAPAFVFPLQWKMGLSDSKYLPKGFVEIAEKVRTTTKIDGWGLSLSECIEDLDLSELNFTAESAWAPLSASLIVADEGGCVMPNVFATGAWSSTGGVIAVEGIEQKLQAVIDLEIPNSKLFVPSSNQREVLEAQETLKNNHVEIKYYAAGVLNVRESLKEHLEILDKPPHREDGDSFESRVAYLNRGRMNSKQSNEYQAKEISDDLAIKIRQKMPKELLSIQKLAMFVSRNWALAVLILKTLRPGEVCLVVSEESKKLVDNIKKYWDGIINEHQPVWSAKEYKETACLNEIETWLLRDRENNSAAVEITGGTKTATAILIAAAKRTNSKIVYLDNDVPQTYGKKEEIREIKYLADL